MKKTKIQTYKEAYTGDYPWAWKLAITQNGVFWPAEEIVVEKDVHDFKVAMTPAEQHATTIALKLFTLYEIKVGVDYWIGRVMKSFPNRDIMRMANSFAFFEVNVHAPFYNQLNEVLHLNTDDFYLSYKKDEVLKSRMEHIAQLVKSPDDLISVAAFSMIEGAVLYSSFAFLKHFQSNGKNKLVNTIRGINFSVRDENLHCIGGASIFQQLKEERLAAGLIDDEYLKNLEAEIIKAAQDIEQHEALIIDEMFSNGPIEGITDVQMKRFQQSRIDLCLSQLGIAPIYNVSYNPIKDWFYENINSYQMNDFFVGVGNQYNRDWDETGFVWDQTLI